MTASAPGAGPGRRAGASTTRAAIAEAARTQFAARGYEGASLRAIARDAGVDPALITYFFGSKQALFAELVELPVDPALLVDRVLAGDPAGVGLRLATALVEVLAGEEALARFVTIIRSAAQSGEVAVAVRDRLTRDVLEPLAVRLQERAHADGGPAPDPAEARLRAGLAMSQVVGFAFARHVIGLGVLAEAPREDVVRALAPTLQRYLVGEL